MPEKANFSFHCRAMVVCLAGHSQASVTQKLSLNILQAMNCITKMQVGVTTLCRGGSGGLISFFEERHFDF